jgi:cytochrome c oxidase subunit 2
LLLTASALVTLTACAGDRNSSPADLDLSPTASAGREAARANGCAACHGLDGEGGAGPPFVGLLGSTVELADGSAVRADETYIANSITDPSRQPMAGYTLVMPATELTADEIRTIVAFIKELPDRTP